MSAASIRQYKAHMTAQGKPVPGTLPDVNGAWRKRPTMPAPAGPEPVSAAQLRASAKALQVQASQLLEEAAAMIAKADALEGK